MSGRPKAEGPAPTTARPRRVGRASTRARPATGSEVIHGKGNDTAPSNLHCAIQRGCCAPGDRGRQEVDRGRHASRDRAQPAAALVSSSLPNPRRRSSQAESTLGRRHHANPRSPRLALPRRHCRGLLSARGWLGHRRSHQSRPDPSSFADRPESASSGAGTRSSQRGWHGLLGIGQLARINTRAAARTRPFPPPSIARNRCRYSRCTPRSPPAGRWAVPRVTVRWGIPCSAGRRR
jgi:hypothetical protein